MLEEAVGGFDRGQAGLADAEVAAVVEQDVRGAAAARLRSMPRVTWPRISSAGMGFQSKAVMFHWTAVRPSSRAVRSTTGRRAPWGARKKRTGAPRVSSRAALQPASSCADAGGGLPREPGVGHGVVADEVSGGGDGADERGALADEAADEEEGGVDLVAGEDFEQPLGGGVVGAVVVGEGDFVGIGACDEHPAEELGLRPEGGVGSGSADGGGGEDGGGGQLN